MHRCMEILDKIFTANDRAVLVREKQNATDNLKPLDLVGIAKRNTIKAQEEEAAKLIAL